MDHTAADWSVELFENQSRRMEIIRKGFAEGLSTEEVNELLTDSYCETLYARNIYEAALIFAFDHHRTYDEWQGYRANADGIKDGSSVSWCDVENDNQVAAWRYDKECGYSLVCHLMK